MSVAKALLLFVFLSVGTFVRGQHVALSSDSTKLIFPNNVVLPVHTRHGDKQFLLSHTAMKTILVQCDYLYDRIDHLSETTALYKREIVTLDSLIHVLKSKSNASQQRTDVYSDAYLQSKSVSAAYDGEIRNLLEDASRLQKKNRSDKRRSFLKGIVSGFVGGVLIVVIYVSTSD